LEGSTTRPRSLTETVKAHERATPHEGDEIVWAGVKASEGGIKSPSITGPANVVGACFIRGDTNPRAAPFGAVITRDVRVEWDRNISKRATIFVMSAKWGVAEKADEGGVKIVTDA
jgi:hypothetical protein